MSTSATVTMGLQLFSGRRNRTPSVLTTVNERV